MTTAVGIAMCCVFFTIVGCAWILKGLLHKLVTAVGFFAIAAILAWIFCQPMEWSEVAAERVTGSLDELAGDLSHRVRNLP